jgi:hypothetical protein
MNLRLTAIFVSVLSLGFLAGARPVSASDHAPKPHTVKPPKPPKPVAHKPVSGHSEVKRAEKLADLRAKIDHSIASIRAKEQRQIAHELSKATEPRKTPAQDRPDRGQGGSSGG